jgi:hypothetical protein
LPTLKALEQLYALGLLPILYDWPVLNLVQRTSRRRRKQYDIIIDALNEYCELMCKDFWKVNNLQEDEGWEIEGELPLQHTTQKCTKETGRWARGK